MEYKVKRTLRNGNTILNPFESCNDFTTSFDEKTATTTVTLLNNIRVESEIVVVSDLVLNLNGHCIKARGMRDALRIGAPGISVTINGDGAISSLGTAVRGMAGSDLVINGGRYRGFVTVSLPKAPGETGGGTVSIRNAEIEGASCGVYLKGPGSSAEIADSRIWGNGCAVSLQAPSGSVSVRGGELSGGRIGLEVFGKGSAADVSDCRISAECAMTFDGLSGSLSVKGGELSGEKTGLMIFTKDSAVGIDGCRITGEEAVRAMTPSSSISVTGSEIDGARIGLNVGGRRIDARIEGCAVRSGGDEGNAIVFRSTEGSISVRGGEVSGAGTGLYVGGRGTAAELARCTVSAVRISAGDVTVTGEDARIGSDVSVAEGAALKVLGELAVDGEVVVGKGARLEGDENIVEGSDETDD